MTKLTPEPEPSRRGVPRDLTRLKRDGSATAAELQEFVANMRGRSPHEVLGMVAQSSLLSGVVLASVITVVLMGAATVGPYAWAKSHPVEKSAAAKARQAKQTDATPAPSEPAPTQAAADAPKAEGDKPQLDKKTLERLGVDEAKSADPAGNPLESKGDDLLNDLK